MQEYYTKEELVNNDFLFISYKHDDKNSIVIDTLRFLFEQGVRFWYDADLVIGQNWADVARKMIMHENCRGVIFFNSVESFTSEPIYLERCYTLERLGKCKSSEKDFTVFPINIDYPSVHEIMRAVFNKFPDADRLIHEFPLKYIQDIAQLFDSNIIYCYADPQDKDGYMQRLCDMISKAIPGVINKSLLQMKRIENTMTTGKTETVYFGKYKDKLSYDVPGALLNNDGRITLNGSNFIISDGTAYTLKELSWRMLYCVEESCVLICEDIVENRNGGSDLKDWLNVFFRCCAFSQEEQLLLEELRLVSEEDLRLLQDNEKLLFSQSKMSSDGHWWIDSMAHGALQKVIKKDGRVFSSGYNIRTKKSGVRPVIVINKEALLKIINN